MVIRRIARTVYPGEFKRSGNLRYIAVPSSVIDRMGLREGDYLDVTLTWPETEEVDDGRAYPGNEDGRDDTKAGNGE